MPEANVAGDRGLTETGDSRSWASVHLAHTCCLSLRLLTHYQTCLGTFKFSLEFGVFTSFQKAPVS